MPAVRFHCPYVGLSECRDGSGNGLTKTSLITHLRDRHFRGEAQATVRHSLLTDLTIFERAEVTLKRMGLWLCGGCFKTHTFRAKCRHGAGSDFVSSPDCGDGVVRFVLYDLPKPQVPSHVALVEVSVLDVLGGFDLPCHFSSAVRISFLRFDRFSRLRKIIMAWGDLPVEGRTLDPLNDDLRHGLTAVTILAFISFFSASTLFFYLVYKLTTWSLFIKSQPSGHFQHTTGPIQRAIDFTLGIDGIFAENNEDANKKADGDAPTAPRRPNQFLVLIINLLLADMHQGVAFFLNAAWLRHNAIMVGTASCYTQGLFVSLGDLASSMFITAIAIHTYLAVVKRRQTPQRVLYAIIIAIWIFVYAISLIPIAVTRNGAEFGGFFVRAGSWCWMNRKYENLRLFTHYLYIFLGLGTTSVLYLIIFFHLRRQARFESSGSPSEADTMQLQLSRNPAFLIYPVIYVMCTLPLAAGRIATMAGANVPNGYFCFAGAMIASNGSFDCLLFGTTRNTIVFASKYDVSSDDVGLSTFAFLKTPSRRFGNTISIQGGQTTDENVAGGWWSWPARASGSENRSRKGMTRTISQESLRGPAIQMDTVTSVVVEVDDSAERDPRYPDTAASSNPSLRSAEKDYTRTIQRSMDAHR